MAIFKMNDAGDAFVLHEFPNEPTVNVGIGQPNPNVQFKLHVTGRIRCDGDVITDKTYNTGPVTLTKKLPIAGISQFTRKFEIRDGIEFGDLTVQTDLPLFKGVVNTTFTHGGKVCTVTQGLISNIVPE